MSKIRLAIAGVGNCASSLVQGIEYYQDADPADQVPGLMHVDLGGYHVRDIEVVAAFDVDADKVGVDVSKAIFAGRNNTVRFADVHDLGVPVLRGPTLDGFGEFYRQECEESPAEPVDVAAGAARPGPTFWSRTSRSAPSRPEALRTGVPRRRSRVRQRHPGVHRLRPRVGRPVPRAGVPIVGDDIKSQVGATIVHRTLARLFEDRGTTIDHTYQLNFGGNMDFMNMLERSRLKSKKVSKTQSVTSQIEAGISDHDVHIGPSDHVPWLEDRKWAFIRLEEPQLRGRALTVELKLEVHDSPNSAGVIIDAVRCAKLALDRGIGGPVLPACQYFMKSPPSQVHDDVAATRSRPSSPRPERQRRIGRPRRPRPRRGRRSFFSPN